MYGTVESKLPKNPAYKVYYQTMHSDRTGEVGIYLYESKNDEEDLSGEQVYRNVKAHVQVNCLEGTNGLIEGLRYLEEFVENIENSAYGINGLQLVSVTHTGPRALPIGKSDKGINICRSVVDIKYI